MALGRIIAGLTIGLASCSQSASKEPGAVAARAQALSSWNQTQELAAGSASSETFGRTLAVSGDTALILSAARASTFRRIGSEWVMQTGSQAVGTCDELNGPATDQAAGTLSGDTALVVGNSRTGHFGPCVYVRSGDSWSSVQALEANNSAEVLLGSYMVSGDTAMMQSSLGVAVFERSSGLFSHTQTLATSDGDTGPKPFALLGGTAVLLSGGSAYLFARQATAWEQTGVMAPDDGQAFGAVAMSAERLLLQSGAGTSIYVRSSSGWVLEAQLSQGGSLDVLGETVLLGSSIYERIGGIWYHTQDLSLDPPPQSLRPPLHYPLTDLALWSGGALVGRAGVYIYDGLTFREPGRVYSFERVTEPDTCTADTECGSGHCVEGVCCQTDCSRPCESCLAARTGGGLDGICGPVTVDTDPRDSCAADPVETCGQTGLCDGAGQCALFPDGAPCVTGYVCESGECATECAPDFGCDTAHGYECVESACQMPPVVGGTGGTSSSGGTSGASEGGSDSDAGGAPPTSAGAGGDTPDATTGGSSGGDAPSASGGAPATSGGGGGAPSTSTGGIDQPAAGAGKTSQPHGLRAGGGCHVRPGAAEHSGWGALFVALLLSTRRRTGFGVASKKRARPT